MFVQVKKFPSITMERTYCSVPSKPQLKTHVHSSVNTMQWCS